MKAIEAAEIFITSVRHSSPSAGPFYGRGGRRRHLANRVSLPTHRGTCRGNPFCSPRCPALRAPPFQSHCSPAPLPCFPLPNPPPSLPSPPPPTQPPPPPPPPT